MATNTFVTAYCPMDSAPKDGTQILLYAESFKTATNPTGVCDGYWDKTREGWVIAVFDDRGFYRDVYVKPELWLPKIAPKIT